MSAHESRRRIGVFIVFPLLVLLLGLLGGNLLRELRDLSTAEVDNLQWTILQVETEIANLSATLSDAVAAPESDADAVRLRADIALSRLLIVGRGEALDLLRGGADDLLTRIETYQSDMVAVLDADTELSQDDIARLRALTKSIRPDIRELVLLGLEAGTRRASERRAEFSRQLAITGAIAIAVILGLSAVLVFLDRLLVRADKRDAELLNSSSRLTSTVAASLDAIVTANESGEIVEFNASAERIFGWSRDEILGRKMDDTIIPHHHRAAHAAGMERYLATHEPHVVDAGRVELSALRRSGEEFPVELNITSVKSADGELFIAYLRDISQRKINEQKLIDARDKAESMDRAKSQFLAVMSHEMRTPLNGILGVLDLMQQTRLTKQQHRYVQVASASGEILLEHVNEAVDITRIEMGSMQLSTHPFEMRTVVEGVVDVLKPLAREKDLTLTLEFDASMDRSFDGDGTRLGQILTNLIGNAIKFTDAGGIEISLSGIHGPDATSMSLVVSDTGRGIPNDRLEDVFEDFVALSHSEGRQSRGDGLGLSISRKVARLMGGDLTVQSTLGEGSIFTFNVPLLRAQVSADETPYKRAERPQKQSDEKCHVLIVEDNAINRSVLRDMLERLGHTVDDAEDGLQGLRKAKSRAFDLIIMDVSMPVMDGTEAARRIRAESGPNKSTRIIGLTAHGREEYRDRALKAGMDGFFTKPIRFSALREVLSFETPSRENIADLDDEVLNDLLEVLGPERAKKTADTFFTDTEAQLMMLTANEHDSAAVLHKMRGGAALIGLASVVAQIDEIGKDIPNDSSIEALRTVLKDSQENLLKRFQRHIQAD
ncbi:MAG: response regulator [Litoreibacter sp.]|nr:response regulator [Litoreibacter sp.]